MKRGIRDRMIYKSKFKEAVDIKLPQSKILKQSIIDVIFDHPKVFVELENGFTIYVKPKVIYLFDRKSGGKKINVAKNYKKLIGQKIIKFFNDTAGITILTKDFQFNLDFPTDGGLIKTEDVI